MLTMQQVRWGTALRLILVQDHFLMRTFSYKNRGLETAYACQQ